MHHLNCAINQRKHLLVWFLDGRCMSEDGGITRLSIGFNKIATVIKVAPFYGTQGWCERHA